MGKQIQLILLLICTFIVIASNHHAIAELLSSILFDKWKLLKHKYHSNRPTPSPLPTKRPLGGKERYDEICRIQKGIPACFT